MLQDLGNVLLDVTLERGLVSTGPHLFEPSQGP